jgi:hypothetical protein
LMSPQKPDFGFFLKSEQHHLQFICKVHSTNHIARFKPLCTWLHEDLVDSHSLVSFSVPQHDHCHVWPLSLKEAFAVLIARLSRESPEQQSLVLWVCMWTWVTHSKLNWNCPSKWTHHTQEAWKSYTTPDLAYKLDACAMAHCDMRSTNRHNQWTHTMRSTNQHCLVCTINEHTAHMCSNTSALVQQTYAAKHSDTHEW